MNSIYDALTRRWCWWKNERGWSRQCGIFGRRPLDEDVRWEIGAWAMRFPWKNWIFSGSLFWQV